MIASKSVLLTFTFCTALSAQDMFPLHVGDIRFYGNPSCGTQVVTVEGTDTVNSKVYYRFRESEYYEDASKDAILRYRKDTTGNVYRLASDLSEHLVFKITAVVGDTWTSRIGYDYKRECEVEFWSSTDTVVTNAGVIRGCSGYFFDDLGSIDEEHGIWLAPGIGIVQQKSFAWGHQTTFQKGFINGIHVPAVVQPLQVVKTVPQANVTMCPVDCKIMLFFNYKVLFDSVKTSISIKSSKLKGPVEGIFRKNLNNIESDLRPSTEGCGELVVFDPARALPYGDTITVTVSTKLPDLMFDTLISPYTLIFTTEEEHAPYFIRQKLSDSTSPAILDFTMMDFDYDGDLDITYLGRSNSWNPLAGILENRAGTFESRNDGFIGLFSNISSALTTSTGIHWVDFNNDRKPDIQYSGIDEIKNRRTLFYMNNGTGFILDTVRTIQEGPAFSDWADINGDGYTDLVFWSSVDVDHSTIRVLRNDTTHFTTLPVDSTHLAITCYRGWYEQAASPVAWLDFNKDGKMDFVAAKWCGSTFVFLENTGSRFVPSTVISPIDIGNMFWNIESFKVIDINADGFPDIFIDGHILVNRNGTSFTYDSLRNNGFRYNGCNPGFSDFDGDGDIDIYIAVNRQDAGDIERGFIDMYENRSGVFYLFKELSLGERINFTNSQWIDFNRDKKLDLVWLDDYANELFVFINQAPFVGTVHPKTGRPCIASPATMKTRLVGNRLNIQYTLHQAAPVSLNLYNARGQQLSTIIRQFQSAGSHSLDLDLRDGVRLAKGIYIVGFSVNGERYYDSFIRN